MLISVGVIIWSIIILLKKEEKKVRIECENKINDTPMFNRLNQPTNAFYNLDMNDIPIYNEKFIKFINNKNVILS